MKVRLSHPCVSLCMAGALSAMGMSSGIAAADGDAAAGARKSIYCAYCHGSDGNPPYKGAPRLAGQDADALVNKMKLQTEALGAHELMIQAFLTGRAMNDQDMNDLAAYFSRQPVRDPVPPADTKSPDK
ncbi:MAG: c-type cytochrome [Thiobacillus sp.]|nr:c-type cytochrome [Thiobacillus sp.]